MGWFSKKKINVVDQISNIFLEQFPTWAVQHATKLVQELKISEDDNEKNWVDLLNRNQSAETMLIDFLTAAHGIYLNFGLPEQVLLLIGGEKKIVTAMTKWSQRSQRFVILASEYHKRILQNGEPLDLTSSLEKMFAPDGKLEPLAVHIGTVATNEIESELNEELGPVFVGGLYRTVFKLQDDLLDWISNEVLDQAKQHA